jgi:uncharacterized protein (DUF1697 family)
MAHIVFLRGVNVGGHRTFRPAVLAQRMKRFDFVNIGAAGTFVVRARVGQSELRSELRRRLPFETEIVICKASELLELASSRPFAEASHRADVVRFVSVLARRPREMPVTPFDLPADGPWLVRVLATRNRFVIGQYRRHMKTIGHLGTLDRVFDTPMTTRNWNTIGAICGVLEKASQRG